MLFASLPALAVLLFLFAAAPHPAHADNPIVTEISLSPREPRCDGDSVTLTVRAHHADGTPAPGVAISVIGPAAWRYPDPSYAPVNGVTDRRGIFRTKLTPNPGSTILFSFFVSINGDRGRYPGPCPLSDGRSFVMDGTLWHDEDGDGVLDANERPLSGRAVQLFGNCYGPGCFYPLHNVRTGSDGAFEFAGLRQYTYGDQYNPAWPQWNICIPEPRHAMTFASLNGVPVDPASVQHLTNLIGLQIAPIACVLTGPLQPGVNHFSVGLR